MTSILVHDKKNSDAAGLLVLCCLFFQKKFTRKQVSSTSSRPINPIYHLWLIYMNICCNVKHSMFLALNHLKLSCLNIKYSKFTISACSLQFYVILFVIVEFNFRYTFITILKVQIVYSIYLLVIRITHIISKFSKSQNWSTNIPHKLPKWKCCSLQIHTLLLDRYNHVFFL